MIPTSTGALVVLVSAVLPGSLFTWAYERQVGAYGVTLADRVLRFVAVSLAFHVAAAWPAFVVWRAAFVGTEFGWVQFAWLWVAVAACGGVPAFVGAALGGLYATRTTRSGWRLVRRWLSPQAEQVLVRWALGRDPAPRAWDYLFSERPSGFLRVRTVDGSLLGGRFATASYSGAFPHASDLYLEEAWEVDETSGAFVRPLGHPVYVADGHVAVIEVVSDTRTRSPDVPT